LQITSEDTLLFSNHEIKVEMLEEWVPFAWKGPDTQGLEDLISGNCAERILFDILLSWPQLDASRHA
jgi:hypothetical protein